VNTGPDFYNPLEEFYGDEDPDSDDAINELSFPAIFMYESASCLDPDEEA
jgi:hypothetical protein